MTKHEHGKIVWTDVVAKKRAERDAAIKSFLAGRDGQDSETQTSRVVEQDLPDLGDLDFLQASISTGRLTAEQVVVGYIKRAILAHEKTNCLTEICFNAAVREAQAQDQILKTSGKVVGPLHGIPVTLKDQFNVSGYDTTLGYTARAFQVAVTDAWLVSTLRRLGAIVIAKSNIPQSIMWCETENPLWGLTTNPVNPAFTPGGSTGGEAVLLALNASVIGFGTDIGGSVRIPSHMNGLWGLKPSSGRLSYQGVPVSTEGQQHVPSSIGPLTRSLSGMTQIMKLLIDAGPWISDPACPPIPWRDAIFQEYQRKRLTIGVMIDDGVVKVHPPIERCLYETVSKLKEAGHEIITWEPSLHAECVSVMDRYYSADGGEDIRRAIKAGGEPFIPHVEALLSRGDAISVYEYWQLNKQKIALQDAYHNKWTNTKSPSGQSVDVLLTPTMSHTALPHKGCRWVGYTKVWNFLDYTALSFPAGKCSQRTDVLPTDYTPRNELDAWNWKQYDAGTMDNHPVGLQIVGRRFDEEKVLAVAQSIVAALATRGSRQC